MASAPAREVAAAHVEALELLVAPEDVRREIRRRVRDTRQLDGQERFRVVRLARAETPVVKPAPLGDQAIRTLRFSYSRNGIHET